MVLFGNGSTLEEGPKVPSTFAVTHWLFIGHQHGREKEWETICWGPFCRICPSNTVRPPKVVILTRMDLRLGHSGALEGACNMLTNIWRYNIGSTELLTSSPCDLNSKFNPPSISFESSASSKSALRHCSRFCNAPLDLFIMLSPSKLITGHDSLPFSGARGGRSLLHAPHCLLARPRPRHPPILPLRQRQGQLASSLRLSCNYQLAQLLSILKSSLILSLTRYTKCHQCLLYIPLFLAGCARV